MFIEKSTHDCKLQNRYLLFEILVKNFLYVRRQKCHDLSDLAELVYNAFACTIFSSPGRSPGRTIVLPLVSVALALAKC